MRWVLALLGCTVLVACSATPPACTTRLAAGDVVYVVSRGWHVEVGLPTAELSGPLTFYRTVFPQARTLMFGYGKRTFFTAKVETPSDYLLGPLPGDAVIQVTGLLVPPQGAYPGTDVLELTLRPGGAQALSDFIWGQLGKDHAGEPRLVAPGNFPGSIFYAARSEYTLAHTCNTWVVQALQAAGLPVSPAGVVFSGQVMARAAAAGGCVPLAAVPRLCEVAPG